MTVCNLEKATVGEKWKDQDGTVWRVYGINEKNNPRLIFFSRAKNKAADKQVERSAFSIETGWQRMSG